MNTCAHCDAALPEYTGRGRRPKYCDKTCSRRAQKAAEKTRPGKPCTENECDRKVVARGLCTMHYKRARRAAGDEPTATPWTEARQRSYDTRRARKRGATIGPAFTRAEVYERDNWTCGLCGERISPSAAYPDPRSPSLDHVIPLALGGAHSFGNAQASHLACNVRKGAHSHIAVDAGETVTTAHRNAARLAALDAQARTAAIRARLVAATAARLAGRAA